MTFNAVTKWTHFGKADVVGFGALSHIKAESDFDPYPESMPLRGEDRMVRKRMKRTDTRRPRRNNRSASRHCRRR